MIKSGWNGRSFEDFEVDDVYEHLLGRTVTSTDNAWFTLLTHCSRSEVLALRGSASRPTTGLVTVRTTGCTHEGTVVITFERTLLVHRRGAGPTTARPAPAQ